MQRSVARKITQANDRQFCSSSFAFCGRFATSLEFFQSIPFYTFLVCLLYSTLHVTNISRFFNLSITQVIDDVIFS